MADIDVIIKIPEEIYTRLLDNGRPMDFADGIVMDRAIRNGTPLPKGHGRIIDESEITQVYWHEEKAERGAINFRGIVIDGTDAQTIIEADKESEDK